MSTPATVVSEISDQLGETIAEPEAVARALDEAHARHSLAPAAWVTVERTLLGLGSRAARKAPRRPTPRPDLIVVRGGRC